MQLAHKSVGINLIVLLGDVGEVETRFSLFGDSVNLEVR